MKKIIHVSNLYATEPSIMLGHRLLALGDFAAVHFGNSGTEANEAAIKFARIYSLHKKGPEHHKLLCFHNAFHGRTMGALSCTPTPKYQEPYAPLIPGVTVAAFNDVEEIKKTLDSSYSGVLVEVVQGEGGMEVMSKEFAEALNELCEEHDIMLIADEVQTGLGRCGAPLASTLVGLKPDMVCFSKPLAAGLPLSATLIPAKVNNELHLGAHGTTFGGGPVTTAVANAVLDTLLDPAFLEDLGERSAILEKELQAIADSNDGIRGVKGLGFLKGLDIKDEAKLPDVMTEVQNNGVLILRSGTSVLRLAPPLTMSVEDLQEGLSVIRNACKKVL